MQTLKLADDLFQGIEEGWKQATIRNGKRDITPGELMMFEGATNEDVIRTVYVHRVSYFVAQDMSDFDAQLDGAETANEMIEALKRFYPDIGPMSLLTLIEFVPT
jgi:hypothetical protein